MKLFIYSIKNVLFQGKASLLKCKTVSGEITVLDNHETLITVLAKGTMEAVEETESGPKRRFFPIKSGFLEVRAGNEARCIVEE